MTYAQGQKFRWIESRVSFICLGPIPAVNVSVLPLAWNADATSAQLNVLEDITDHKYVVHSAVTYGTNQCYTNLTFILSALSN